MGKPAVATIALNAFQKGNQVVVEIEDDGQGIDDEALIRAAVASGVLSSDESHEISRRDALNLVFLPGVTTRKDISRTSGRGVGMDVVKTNIGKLGGVVDVHSDLGIGTKFTITLPITLAIIGALLVEVAGATYAVPLSSVQEAVTVEAASARTIEGREVLTLRGESLPICRLDVLFRGRELQESLDRSGKLVVVIGSAAARRCGFVVDRIIGRQDIVIKALGGPVRSVKGFAGATELGDERVALVLDTPLLIEEAIGGRERDAGGGGPRMPEGTSRGAAGACWPRHKSKDRGRSAVNFLRSGLGGELYGVEIERRSARSCKSSSPLRRCRGRPDGVMGIISGAGEGRCP